MGEDDDPFNRREYPEALIWNPPADAFSTKKYNVWDYPWWNIERQERKGIEKGSSSARVTSIHHVTGLQDSRKKIKILVGTGSVWRTEEVEQGDWGFPAEEKQPKGV